jgi:hypothetical protein
VGGIGLGLGLLIVSLPFVANDANEAHDPNIASNKSGWVKQTWSQTQFCQSAICRNDANEAHGPNIVSGRKSGQGNATGRQGNRGRKTTFPPPRGRQSAPKTSPPRNWSRFVPLWPPASRPRPRHSKAVSNTPGRGQGNQGRGKRPNYCKSAICRNDANEAHDPNIASNKSGWVKQTWSRTQFCQSAICRNDANEAHGPNIVSGRKSGQGNATGRQGNQSWWKKTFSRPPASRPRQRQAVIAPRRPRPSKAASGSQNGSRKPKSVIQIFLTFLQI